MSQSMEYLNCLLDPKRRAAATGGAPGTPAGGLPTASRDAALPQQNRLSDRHYVDTVDDINPALP